jgi:hypothetical protein
MNLKKIKRREKIKRLYKFYWDRRSMGNVEGLFIEEEEVINKVIGQFVGFVEVLGKRSDICGYLKDDDFKAIDLPSDTIKTLELKMGKVLSGYNPIEYILCYECGCGYDTVLGKLECNCKEIEDEEEV